MNQQAPGVGRHGRGWVYAVILFFVAPLVAEYLLGNLPITLLVLVPVLAPLYGGGALLIREVARRFKLGWPGLLLLALAYAVVEEAFTTQTLFNPNYLGLHLLDFGYIPALGMSSWWTIYVLAIHVIWSMATPVALVEALSGPRRREPWLGGWGLFVTTALFGLGCVVTTAHQLKTDAFRATAPQLTGAAVAVIALVFVAFVVGRRAASSPRISSTPVPSSRALVAIGLGLGTAFMVIAAVINSRIPVGLSVGGMLATLVTGALLLRRWSRSAGWKPGTETAFAGGILLTYVWYGFVQVPSVGAVSPGLDALGNLVFSSGALLLLAQAWKTSARWDGRGSERGAQSPARHAAPLRRGWLHHRSRLE